MAITLKTLGIIVKDMGRTLQFYRMLGFDIPAESDQEPNIEFQTPSGLVLGFLTEAMAAQSDSNYTRATGNSLNLQFECDSPAEVDRIYALLTKAGNESYAEPWDAFWGQRFARITDPDGRVINLYAEL